MEATRAAGDLSGEQSTQLLFLSAYGHAWISSAWWPHCTGLTDNQDSPKKVTLSAGDYKGLRNFRCSSALLAFHGRFVDLSVPTPILLEVTREY